VKEIYVRATQTVYIRWGKNTARRNTRGEEQ